MKAGWWTNHRLLRPSLEGQYSGVVHKRHNSAMVAASRHRDGCCADEVPREGSKVATEFVQAMLASFLIPSDGALFATLRAEGGNGVAAKGTGKAVQEPLSAWFRGFAALYLQRGDWSIRLEMALPCRPPLVRDPDPDPVSSTAKQRSRVQGQGSLDWPAAGDPADGWAAPSLPFSPVWSRVPLLVVRPPPRLTRCSKCAARTSGRPPPSGDASSVN